MLGSATALVWVALWHFWGWRSEVAIASSQSSTKTSDKRRSSNSHLPAADPVEVELNQMSAELGNTRMRPVRKSQSPTQKSQSPTQKSQSPTQKSQSPTQKPKSPTQKPKSEQPQWYVFRSGKAEGPYTKDQLPDVQKISDRTKVRRGEAEWQRAGEISELALFLTQK